MEKGHNQSLSLRDVLAVCRTASAVGIDALSGRPISDGRRLLAARLHRLFRARLVSVVVYDQWRLNGPVRIVQHFHVGPLDTVARERGIRSQEPFDMRQDPLCNRLLEHSLRRRARLAASTVYAQQLIAHTAFAQRSSAQPATRAQLKLGTPTNTNAGEMLLSAFGVADGGAVVITIQWPPGTPARSRDRTLLHLLARRLFRLHRRAGIGCVGFVLRPSRDELTLRQKQVLDALLDGRSTKEIAAKLGVRGQTVAGYVKDLYRIYEVHSRGELMALFVRGQAPPLPSGQTPGHRVT